jgi:sugar lactone lactonase YvrE
LIPVLPEHEVKLGMLVQPSGISLSTDGRELWVADSESSTVRSMDISSGGSKV